VNPGDVVLIQLNQVGGGPSKIRPALALCALPGPYQNALVCGISTQMHGLQHGWDELIDTTDSDFGISGLKQRSAIRLSYLYAAESADLLGTIGRVDSQRWDRLRHRLASHLIR
jgi:mRNA interferase MazF